MGINYITEFNEFMEYAMEQNLPTNERALYLSILYIFNKQSKGNDWPRGFVGISNKKLESMLPFTQAMLVKVRARLLNRKPCLLEYKAGCKNSLVPMYKLNYFSEKEAVCDRQESIKADFEKSNIDTKKNWLYVGDMAGLKGKVEAAMDNDIDVNKADVCIENRLYDEIAGLFEGWRFTKKETTIKKWIAKYSFDVEVYRRCMELSRGKEYPILYISKVLEDWHSNGVPAEIKKEGPKVMAQMYSQRVYEEDDYNVWQPEFNNLELVT